MTWLAQNWLNIVAAATSLITAASIIARMTPSKSDDAVVDKVLKVIQWLSINGTPKN
jgi:hypothetical protein